MKLRLFIFLSCVYALPALSFGKDAAFVFVSSGMAYGPGDAPWIYESGTDGCFMYDKFIVKVSNYKDPGQDIVVYKREKNLKDHVCAVDSQQSVLTLMAKEMPGNPGVKEFTGFYGIFRNRMFVDTGTYEFGRVLDIYDLDTGKILHTTNYNHGVIKAKGWAVSFWRTKEDFKNASECPNKISCEHGGLELEENIILNLSNFKEKVTGSSCHCSS